MGGGGGVRNQDIRGVTNQDIGAGTNQKSGTFLFM